MRAVRHHEHGGPEVLRVDDVPRPSPDADEVLVAVGACSVNPLETYIQQGETHIGAELPVVPGSDFAGTVEAVGENVTGYAQGDRVLGAGLAFARGGPYAEFVTAPVRKIAPLPAGVGFEAGAAIGHVGVTAWRSIVELGRPAPGDRCLVHGGSGGVGHGTVQLADLVGARVVATAGSRENRRRVESLGAEVTLDYARDDLAEAVLDAAPDGVAVSVDHLPEEYLELDIDVAAHDGRVVVIDGYDVRIRNLRKTRRKDLTIMNTGALSSVASLTETLERLGELLDAGDLTAVVHRTFPLSEAAEAQRTMLEESYVGKVVLVP